MSSGVTTTTPFVYLRRASPSVLALIEQLRLGARLPVDPSPEYAEAARLWSVERDIVQRWASDVRRGTRRRRCPEVSTWSQSVRRIFGVDDSYERSQP
jgi:hypothetical protein